MVTGISASAAKDIQNRVNTMTGDVLRINSTKYEKIHGKTMATSISTKLSFKDEELLKRRVSGLSDISSQVQYVSLISTTQQSISTSIIGVEPPYFKIMRLKLQAGRFFIDTENMKLERIAVIGSNVATRLFPNKQAIDQDIKIKGMPFKIIGVLSPRGIDLNGKSEDDIIVIPIKTAMFRLINIPYVHNLYLKVNNQELIAVCISQCAGVLRDSHKLRNWQPNDFSVQDQSMLVETARETSGEYQKLGFLIALISYISGGISVLVIMILVIQERTVEIGLRRAIGASNFNIFFQFFMEAIILAAIGSISGFLFGLGLCPLLQMLTGLPVAMPPLYSAWSIVASLVIAGSFGFWPAVKAATLEPAVAIRKKL